MHLNSEWLSLLPTILAEVLFVALFIVAAVRSRGVARILLSIWIVTSTVGAILSILAPYLFGSLGITGPSFVLWLLGMLNAVLLGLVLIIGRPGYRGEDDRRSYRASPILPLATPETPARLTERKPRYHHWTAGLYPELTQRTLRHFGRADGMLPGVRSAICG